MQHTKKRLIIVGGAVAAAMAGSAIVASPAFAADPLQGTVVDGSTPVADVSVYLLRFDADSTRWDSYTSLGDTGPDGKWTSTVLGASLDPGKYALWYDVSDSPALYSRAQSSNGLSAKDGSTSYNDDAVERLAFPTDFTVTSGVASTVTFTESLVHNAGAVQVPFVDGTGAAINSGNSSFGEVDLNEGFDTVNGSLDGVDTTVNAPDFTGTVTVGHATPGFYSSPYVYAGGFQSEPLNPITVAAGATTSAGPAVLQANGAPYVASGETLPRAVTVTGAPKVGTLLTAVLPSLTNGAPFTVTYQWYSGGSFVSDGRPLIGATSQTFAPTADNIGDQLYVTAVIRQPGHTSDVIYSNAPTDPVTVGDPNQAVVTVTGTASFGKTLKATVTGGTVVGAKTASYQWYRNGAPISGADGSSYTVTKTDVGQKVFASATSFAQGHTDAVIPSNTVSVAKDKATVTIKETKSGKKIKLKVTLKNGASNNTATGKVKVFYTATKSKTVTFGSKTASKTVTVTKLKSGKIKIKYLGDSHYVAKTYTVKATK